MGREILDLPPPPPDSQVAYGGDPNQFYELRIPESAQPQPLLITIHGGFWRAVRGLQHMGHLCAAMKDLGIATCNLEYRRLGQSGGGWPGTFQDIVQAVEHAAPRFTRLSVTGFSAGGHLALLLAKKRRIPAVSLAGVADLGRAIALQLSENVAAEFLGPGDLKEASPMEQLPARVRTRLIHGTADDVVPFEIAESYVKAAQAAGDDSELVTLAGGSHFDCIDPRSPHWPLVRSAIERMVRE